MIKEWTYLLAKPYQARQILAAHYVQGCKNVVEIGSYRLPTVHFLTGPHENVLCVDSKFGPDEHLPSPYKRNGRMIAKHVAYAPDWSEIWDYTYGGFGLVMLGFDILRKHHSEILELIRASDVTVIESWADWPLFNDIFDKACALKSHGGFSFDLNFLATDRGPRDWPVRNNRRMLVLEKK